MSASTRTLSKQQFELIAKALADPRRFELLQTIAGCADYPCSRLCQEFPVSKATISHHAKELVRAGLIEADRCGQYVNFRVRRDVLAAYTAALHERLSPAAAPAESVTA